MTSWLRKGASAARHTDWLLGIVPVVLTLIGIATMHTFGTGASHAPRQLMWLALSSAVFVGLVSLDLRFIRRTPVIVSGYLLIIFLLVLLLAVAPTIQGAKAWFSLGPISFQPADAAKLVLIALCAKYFSRRHIEIANVRHVIISGLYVAIPLGLILIQPDLGTAAIIGLVWFGLILVSGVPKKHIAIVLALGALTAGLFWSFGLHDYQRDRIVSFLNPAADPYGAGYNAYQAVIATGSGEVFGKGIGYGTQSKLRFLPEYQTDFIFAAFVEEWGFMGMLLVLSLYAFLLARLVAIARYAASNFDAFFTLGVMILFLAHLFLHVGINVGILPVTGTTIPFMSSGGSHLLMEFVALGVVASLARHGREVPKAALTKEYHGYGSL